MEWVETVTFLSARSQLDLAISMIQVGHQKRGLKSLKTLAESFDELIRMTAEGTGKEHPAVQAYLEDPRRNRKQLATASA